MIHNVLLIDKVDGSVITRVRFWKIDFTEQHIAEFLAGYRDLMSTQGLASDTPIFVGKHKVFHGPVDDEMLLLFVTDGRDEDRVIRHKVREGASRISVALRGNTISYIRDNLDELLGELIFTRFKVSFVGSGGVGKSTLLRLLFGREPAPGGYVPTINVAVDSSETIQFGTFMVTMWDFAGQAVFQDLWAFYFQGTDVIFLITDSSFRNVMATKTLLRNIRKEAPAVPLFIIANKQDLPESMKADKIQRLLGAPTFPMVATDKARREEFIRLMLEVAAKTVGVQLPDMPLSEMITVHRKTDARDMPDAIDTSGPRPKSAQTGLEHVPYEAPTEDLPPESHAVGPPTETTGSAPTVAEAESGPSDEAKKVSDTRGPSKLLQLTLMVRREEAFETVLELPYAEELSSGSPIAGLVSALDSFGGIDAESETADKTDALETIEHEGNLVMVEKSKHFVMALTVTNDTDEDARRRTMASALLDIERAYADSWDSWDGSTDAFEGAVFAIVERFPLRAISDDYTVRAREVGQPLPFNSREVGRALVTVLKAIEQNTTVGTLVSKLDLPRSTVIGSLQILARFGWVDFKVELNPKSIPKKVGEVDDDLRKTYGDVIVKFVDLCDGRTTLEDVVKKVSLSLPAMRFVATKLVLQGVLEIVA
ncbi:MAG: GTP-binding protein [Candidatus Thorarchaeota archaeon]|nr:GTP-binding protein [Candidatus Thorarchaeota archaeon]